MDYYEIIYRKSYYCTPKKFIKAINGKSDAIQKSKLKYDKIISVTKISEQEYKDGVKAKRQRKEAFRA